MQECVKLEDLENRKRRPCFTGEDAVAVGATVTAAAADVAFGRC